MKPRRVLSMIVILGAVVRAGAGEVNDVLEKTGIARGAACVPDCGDGQLALELARNSELLVLAMDPDPANVAAAKQNAADAGLIGRRLYVQQGTLEAIPFADNYVDLLVLPKAKEASLSQEQRAEILRALTPVRGRAVLADKTIEKPELAGSDWWPHKLHGPNNNPVSKDTVFRFPPILQYRAMPLYTTAFSASFTVRGVHIEVNDWLFKNPLRANLSGRIIARNAYNGQILWEAIAPENTSPNTPTVAATDTALLMASGDAGSIVRLDLATGKPLAPIVIGGKDRRVKWLAHEKGVLYVLMGGIAEIKPAFTFYAPGVVSQWEKHTLFGDELIAWDNEQDRQMWRHKEPALIDYRNVALHKGRLCFYAEKARLACLNAANGELIWENREGDWLERLNRPPRPHNWTVTKASSLILTDNVARLAVAECKDMFLFQADDGQLVGEASGSIQKSLIVEDTLYVGHKGYDAKTGKLREEKAFSPAGLHWCGLVTYAPGTGMLGHSTLGYKSACAAGAWVAGGMLIYSPTICDCGAVTGTGAFASGDEILHKIRGQPEHPLVKGEAFGRVHGSVSGVQEAEWSAYRGGTWHRGSSPASVGRDAAVAWTSGPDKPFEYSTLYNQFVTSFDERPVPPIAAGDTVFSAGSDGMVAAFALEDGKRRWAFHADGPILTSPAWSEGMLFVPCCDGWVYALDAENGALAWKRRLAPVDRRILIFGQLGSNWPVLSLIVDRGVVFASAGHCVTDGVKTFALNGRTGEIIWSHFAEPATESFQGTHNPPDRPIQGCGGAMTRVGDRVWTAGFFSPPLSLDLETGEDHLLPLKRKLVSNTSFVGFKMTWYMRGHDLIGIDDRTVLAGGGDLFDNHQLREGKRRRTAYKMYAADDQGDWVLDPAPPDAFVSRIAPACDDQLMVFAAPPSYEIRKGQKRERRGFSLTTAGLNVWTKESFIRGARAMQSTSPIDRERSEKDRLGRVFMQNPYRIKLFNLLEDDPARWRKPELDVSAIALAADAVLVAHAAGYENLYTWNAETLSKRQALMKYRGWSLTGFDRETGDELWSVPLPSEPLYNGIAVAPGGTVIMTLRDGTLLAVAK